jgi:hypothetical protein
MVTTTKTNLAAKFQEIKERRLERLIKGGLLKRTDAQYILQAYTETVRRTLRRLSQSVEKEVVILAIAAYLVLL